MLFLSPLETPCPENYTRCDDGVCVESRYWCDGYGDCADRSDELMCCPDTQFNCANGRCIEWDMWCDGTNDDCRDNSDEDNCAGKIQRKKKDDFLIIVLSI